MNQKPHSLIFSKKQKKSHTLLVKQPQTSKKWEQLLLFVLVNTNVSYNENMCHEEITMLF